MGCVNKSSREFIQLARRHNLDHNILELITHKYWLERGSEELFPSDVYILAQLGNTQYLERNESIRNIWKSKFSQPETFSNHQDFLKALDNARTFFPKEAIHYYKDANGNEVLKVSESVEKLEFFDGKMSPVLDGEGHIIPAITAQEEGDYVIIARQMALNSEKSATFAPSITQIQELNQKVLSNLEQELQLDKYESRPEGNAATVGNYRQAGNGGLLGESQARVKGRDRSLRETEEQGVLTPKQERERNAEDKADLEKLAKEQGRWRDHLIDRLEEKYGKKIGKGSEAFAYREEGGPVIKARTIDPDVEGSYKSIEDALASIEIHNRLFPETAMKIIGYGEDEGEFNVIIQQPYIDGRYATQEEIDQFIQEKFGAEKDPSVIGDTSFKTAAYLLQDLKPQNIIVKDGKLYVIDGDFYLTEQHKQYLRLQEKQEETAKPKPKQPSKKERQVIGPQPFTFNDGTTVTVPFKPNAQQAEALNQMNDFIHSNETSMTLSGYAGTGKTSLMEIIAQKMRREHKPVTFSATTNKAAAVLKARVSKAGFDAQTLNKVFGINVEVDTTKAYNARNLVTALREADIFPGTTVIIDEASMINEENYRILNKIARDNGLKIIYVGDKAQLAPVNETQVSKVFRNAEGRVVELTQVERTDDNAILKEATALRNGQPLSGESSFNEKGEGVGYLTPKSREEVGKVIRHYIQGLKENPNFFRILAYTNKAVTAYNNFVRNLLGYTDPIPHVGEPLTGYTNWGYDWKTKTYRFINSESYKVTHVGNPQTTSISVNGQSFTMQYVPVTMENSIGERDTFNYMDIKGNQENRQAALMLANQKKMLWEQYRRAVGREAKRDILQQINSIDQFLFVNDNLEDGNHNLLQSKTVDFGYALTIHKSQGSTFTHVLMDDIDVSKASSSQNSASNALATVDLGNAGQVADASMVARSVEDIDLGDLSGVSTEPTFSATPNPNVADVRQQLRYVGVSRATNTVTIVSDKVKKEGSPLNPQSEVTASETITQAESRSNNKQETNETNRATEASKHFPEFLGQHGEGQKASRVLESASSDRRANSRGNEGKEPIQRGQLLLEIEAEAKKEGVWFDRPAELVTKKIGEGQEQIVLLSKDNKNVIKFNPLKEVNSREDLSKFVERLNAHNEFAANVPYTILGFAKDKGGNIGILLQQPYVQQAMETDQYTIDTFMKNAGYKNTTLQNGRKGWANGVYEVGDVVPRNVLMDIHGTLYFIDADVVNAPRVVQWENAINEERQNNLLPIEDSPTETPQQVSLPSYEYFMDRYEDTTVDAAWKIPLLQQLDSQLNNDNTMEQNYEILGQMTHILETKSQEDLLDLEASEAPKQKKQVEQNLTEFEKTTQQINNLLDSNIISASEIRHIAELVINSISDTITILQKEEGTAEKFFPNLQTNLDFQTASRKEIVEAIGINNLIHRAKLQFDPEQNDYEDFDQIEQADLIIDNWEAVMTLASDIFAMNEGFGITRNYDKGGFATTTQNTQADFDNFNDYHNDAEAVAEEKDEQEHWQVEQRTIDVLNSMSQLVRLALHECYQTNKDGSKVMSKWDIAERVNPRTAVNSILRWTQGALTLEDMISRMTDKAIQNPWLNQLVERLSDKSGKETDFQSQFFGVFSKHFQPYSVVLLEDGKYHSIPVNSHPALSEAMQTITTQFKMGQHPLFSGNGKINAALLGSKNRVGEKDTFSLHKALNTFEPLVKKLYRLVHKQYGAETLTKEETTSAIANLVGVSRIIGYNITENMLENLSQEQLYDMMTKVKFLVNSLDKELQAQRENPRRSYNPFAFGTNNNIGGTLRNFLTPVTDSLEDTIISAFYDSGKMYQSYVTPSYMTKLMNKFHLEGQEYADFIMKEYGSSEWFNAGDTSYYPKVRWRNEWLRWLGHTDNRKKFDHKVELNFNKHNYMRNMSDAEYTLSLITEYFAENEERVAWYRIPMLSNKPSSEFIKGPKYEGFTYKDEIIRGLHQMFNQELSRIQTVLMRNHSKNDPQAIKNFDTNGKKFNFLPFLNQFLDKGNHSELARLLQRKVEGLSTLKADEEARLATLVDQAIRQDMEDRVARILNEWENNGILEAAKSIKDIHPAELKGEDIDRWVRGQIENFLWNDAFASKNILQLTITDIAFYKDAEDLQKRLAQIHAPGIRGNVAATDYEGNRVSDGTYRTFILQDFDSFKSNIIANISEVFDRKIAAAPESQKKQLMALKESLVGKDGKYTKINVTDAQGYSSPASYRKKAFIFGRWSRQAEDIYQKLQKGEYNYTDLETAFQPLKPFVYSHLQKNMGVSNAPIQQMPVPFQAKNAEYLLIMADAILQGEELSRPNLLRAVYRVMEDSERLNPTKGIDTVQFESAIKSGLQGRINIHQFLDTVGGEEAAYQYMMELLYKKGTDGIRSNEYNTDTYVQEAPYENYCLQQEVPEHFKDHAQAHGSQIRMITPSDLDFYKNPNGDRTAEDNQVFYEWTEPDGTKKKVRADEFRKEYEQTIAQNIAESIDALSKELHIDSSDKKERNIALSKILQREILSSPRYGIDLIQACSIDRNTGEFRIPKGDPIQAKRIEQLINSIIKNRVNKQKIAGGPIVQVSNFGTSRQLHIRFNDKNGNLLMTREEYEQNPQKKELSQTDKFKARYGDKPAGSSGTMTYEEYVKENQAGIAYFEVFIPIWANEIFEKFSNEDGTINMDALEATDPELLKMVSYRIPTEDKYSCAPMKVVGFMPREAGDAIMLPYELTEIDDSDFDVDKRYVMRKNIPIVRKERSEIEQQLFELANESYKKAHEGKENKKFIGEQVKMFMDNPEQMRYTDNLMRWLYSHYQKIAYTTEAPTSGRTYRDNKIVDMTWAVLTNEMTADKILNPGGFDAPKKMGYMVAAYKNPANNLTWEELQSKSIDELKNLSYQEKDLTWADTQVQFYRQNSAAASLIGVFAVNKVAHATLESNDIQIAVDEICGKEPFTIADTEFGGRMFIDAKYDGQGNLIGKTLGSLVSASADAVKDPILNLMNINMTTAGTLNTMLRLGMSFDDAALFLSQNVIERVLNEFNRENLTNYQPLSAIIDRHLQEYRDRHNITDDSAINKEPLSREELVEGLLPADNEAIDYKVLLAFQKVRKLTDAIRKPTFATRFNSISSAVGPLIIDNLIMEYKMEKFKAIDNEEGTHFYDSDGIVVDIDDIFNEHPVLKQFSRTVDIAKIMFSDMPAGSTGFRNLLATLPEGLVDKVYNDKKLLDNLSNFYQSYLLIASQMVNPVNLKNYIEGFPKYFADQKFKEKYPDNALIQAIRINVSKRTGRPFLSINITGIDEAQKEIYRSAWIDLHKDNPELSKRLFEYCFFRAGIGFSPKTFMSLVPAYVKERLSTNLANGSQATYVDTYRNFPTVNPNVVIDQWVRNNWDNNKLVPKKGGEGTHYQVDLRNGRLVVRNAQDMADLKGVTYMKTRHNGQTYLWKLMGNEEQNHKIRIYSVVKPLGNNGEYMEMGLDNILKPLSDTKETVEDMQESELAQTSPSEADAASEVTGEVATATETSKEVAEMADLVMKQNPKFNKTQALNQIERMKEKPDIYAGFLANVFKQKGLNLTKEEALREFKKLC